HRLLAALADTAVPAPRPLALAEAGAVPGGPVLVVEAVEGVAITDALPPGHPPPEQALPAIGAAGVDALVELQAVPWRRAGLADFGRPEGFLGRQVGRWQAQLERYRTRELPHHAELAAWLEAERPPDAEPAIMHGDLHLDNCLVSTAAPIRVT